MYSFKFLSAAAAALLVCAGAFAQEDGNRDANGKIVRGPYETNSFGSNWFVSVGGGIDLVLDGVRANSSFDGGLTPTLDVNFGKWFTPSVGARFGYGLTRQQARRAVTTSSTATLCGTFPMQSVATSRPGFTTSFLTLRQVSSPARLSDVSLNSVQVSSTISVSMTTWPSISTSVTPTSGVSSSAATVSPVFSQLP